MIKLNIQLFGGRGASSSKWEVGTNDNGGNESKISTYDFVARVNRMHSGNKMSFDIMLNNFRNIFTTNNKNDSTGSPANTKEHLIAVDEDGFAHTLRHGTSHQVNYTNNEVKGMMIIHNHPTDGSFSRADLSGLKESGIKGIVAQGVSGDYIFRVGKHFDYDGFAKALQNSPVTNSYTRRSDETNEQARARISRWTNQWLGQNAKKFGYTFEHRKAKKLKSKDKIIQ